MLMNLNDPGQNSRQKTTFLDRFWANIDVGPSDRCWLWRGPKTKHGYGQTYVYGHGKYQTAHRISYALHHSGGDMPGSDMFVCHTCDTPLCVNPAHLFLGTYADNNADRHRKGRDARGERSGGSKLTEEDVLRIRELGGTMFGKDIAKMFGIKQSQVNKIHNHEMWKHVGGPRWRASDLPKHTEIVCVCVTHSDKDRLFAAANAEGMSYNAWSRDIVISAIVATEAGRVVPLLGAPRPRRLSHRGRGTSIPGEDKLLAIAYVKLTPEWRDRLAAVVDPTGERRDSWARRVLLAELESLRTA